MTLPIGEVWRSDRHLDRRTRSMRPWRRKADQDLYDRSFRKFLREYLPGSSTYESSTWTENIEELVRAMESALRNEEFPGVGHHNEQRETRYANVEKAMHFLRIARRFLRKS